MRNLILVLGDQLDHTSSAFDGFDCENDVVWMAEAAEETTHVWCHKMRIAFFLSAMRHFRDDLKRSKCAVEYHQFQEDASRDRGQSFAEILRLDIKRLQPESLVMVEPGDWRVRKQLETLADELDIALDVRLDRHFYCSNVEFSEFAAGRKS